MLDTVKVRSEPISEGLATAIERQMMRTQRTDLATGEVLYELTGAQLSGTYDHRISCRVERTELGVDPIRSAGKRAPMVERLHCRPYVVVEGSVHKALLGHNVWGGPVDLVAPVRWLVADVGRRLHVELPDGAGWRLQRVDWAEVYDLGCYEACEEYLAGFAAAAFPRREVARYGAHSVHAAGQRTSVKAYHKGPEFSRHDSRRLRHYLQEEPMGQDDSLPDLQAVANRLLRIEVEIRHRKLCDDGANPLEKTLQLGEDGILRVGNVTVEYLTAIHDQESRRLLREGAKDMQTVRTFREVETRLGMLHSATLARSLFSTWVKFATLGEEHAKKGMCRRTFYLHRKQLVAAGCSWHESDIHLDPVASKIPAGFSPVRWDPRRLTSEHPRVAEQLELLRKAA